MSYDRGIMTTSTKHRQVEAELAEIKAMLNKYASKSKIASSN